MILLDEPTEGIQPSINDEIVETLQLLRAKRKLTMVIVEQKRDFIASLASRALVMQKGRIAKDIPANELLKHDEFE
jgi:branched-chain amino acid transport system ATP-binding protein